MKISFPVDSITKEPQTKKNHSRDKVLKMGGFPLVAPLYVESYFRVMNPLSLLCC